MKRQVEEWRAKADEDLASARILMRGRKPLFNQVCFHSQQAAEKYLKAFLEQKGCAIPRTHDLVALVNLARPELDFLLLGKERLERLTGYAVAFRYPGEQASRNQAKQSLTIAIDLARTIITRLKPKS
jgi:HEPN domain-containing protein